MKIGPPAGAVLGCRALYLCVLGLSGRVLVRVLPAPTRAGGLAVLSHWGVDEARWALGRGLLSRTRERTWMVVTSFFSEQFFTSLHLICWPPWALIVPCNLGAQCLCLPPPLCAPGQTTYLGGRPARLLTAVCSPCTPIFADNSAIQKSRRHS